MADITSYDITNYRSRLNNILGTPTGVANSTPATLQKSPLTYSSPVIAPTVVPTAPVVKTTPVVKAPVVVTQPVNTGAHTVVAGDTLGAIASKNGMTVAQLQALNPSITDPNKIVVGQTINLGKATTPVTPTTPTTPTLTPEQQLSQTNTDLAKKAGEAGLSVAEYQNLMNSQNAVSKEDSDRIAKELGITALEGTVFAKPSQSSQTMYQNAYDTAGLADVKTKISALMDEIAKDRSQLTDATGAIDENPFLTETSRVGRGKRLLDQAEAKINNKLEQVKQLQTVYDQGVGEINAMVTRNQNDFGTNQALDTAKLNYLVAKAEKQAGQLQTSRTAGTAGTYLSSLAGSKTPSLVGSNDTGYFKYDTTLKKFVQVIAPSAKAGLDITNQQLQNQKLQKEIANIDKGGVFKPNEGDKSKVGTWLTSDAGKALYDGQTLTSSDINTIMSDPTLFYSILEKANNADN
jgi:LysM repeat protein